MKCQGCGLEEQVIAAAAAGGRRCAHCGAEMSQKADEEHTESATIPFGGEEPILDVIPDPEPASPPVPATSGREELMELLRIANKELDDVDNPYGILIIGGCLVEAILCFALFKFFWALLLAVGFGALWVYWMGMKIRTKKKDLLDTKHRSQIHSLAARAGVSAAELSSLIARDYKEVAEYW